MRLYQWLNNKKFLKNMTTPKNPYLMEKQKSFETVYELKSETPSFEEFANSYECDENISNIYHLENQSQEKGYGSCIDGRSETYCHCSIEDIRIQIINNTYYVLKRPSPPDHHRIRVNFFTSFSDEYFFSNSAF
jgi:hypothetical protein